MTGEDRRRCARPCRPPAYVRPAGGGCLLRWEPQGSGRPCQVCHREPPNVTLASQETKTRRLHRITRRGKGYVVVNGNGESKVRKYGERKRERGENERASASLNSVPTSIREPAEPDDEWHECRVCEKREHTLFNSAKQLSRLATHSRFRQRTQSSRSRAAGSAQSSSRTSRDSPTSRGPSLPAKPPARCHPRSRASRRGQHLRGRTG